MYIGERPYHLSPKEGRNSMDNARIIDLYWARAEEAIDDTSPSKKWTQRSFGERGYYNMKKERRLLDIIGEVDEKYIDEAIPAEVKKRPTWIKWASVAACFAIAIVVGIGVKGGWFEEGADHGTLSNGVTINFIKSDMSQGSVKLDMDVTIREMVPAETNAVFGDLPVTAGYFITDPNSRGEQIVIYYADFKLGDSTVHMENAGSSQDSETIKNELVEAICKIIALGDVNPTEILK